MVANDWMAQDLADILGVSVERPTFAETTALGAAMLAGVGCGLFRDLEEAARGAATSRCSSRQWQPISGKQRLTGWNKAVRSVISKD